MPLARDILIDILRDEGVTHVFGNPGSTEMPLMDAPVDAPDLAYVLGLQEATAVGMADGWALASGRVGMIAAPLLSRERSRRDANAPSSACAGNLIDRRAVKRAAANRGERPGARGQSRCAGP